MTDPEKREAWLREHALELEERRAAKRAERDAEKRAWLEAKAAPKREAAAAAIDVTTSLEALLTSPLAFGLVGASPLQRALCAAADGRPAVLPADGLKAHFGCDALPEPVAPETVVVVAGIRGGKSLIAGAAAFKSACAADLSGCLPHEIVRVSIVANSVTNATKTFRLLAGAIQSSAMLSAIVPPDEMTADTMRLHRPSDGREVEIAIVAAHRGGATIRSDWCAGYVFDEVALFGTESDGAVVNAEELFAAANTRLLPGAQGWLISSPFGPEGLLYRLWKEHFGKPSAEYLVIHAPTRAMNPTFPQAKIDKVRASNPDVAAREYDAQWLDADTAYFVGAQIEAAACDVEEPKPAAAYVAAWDAATRGNAWTLVAGRLDADGVLVIADGWEWIGSKAEPLDPEDVIAKAAEKLKPYRVTSVYCDQWATDALRPIARRAGLALVEQTATAGSQLRAARKLATALSRGACRLAAVPTLLSDLKAVRRRALANAVRVELPTTADGRHCDFAPAVWLVADALLGETEGVVSYEVASSMLRVGAPSVLDGAMDDDDGDGEEAA